MVCNQQAISAVSRRFSSESAVYAPAARMAKNWPITTRRCAAGLWLNGTDAGMDELRRLRVRAAGSIAEGSPRARPEWRAICLYEAAAESTSGSIGSRGGSYCRRASSVRGGIRAADCKYGKLRNCNLGKSAAFTEIFDYESITKM